tara:strand:- start:33 stop:137 length:105 start_codon:yes stop_codon:yes gene_type:complete
MLKNGYTLQGHQNAQKIILAKEALRLIIQETLKR